MKVRCVPFFNVCDVVIYVFGNNISKQLVLEVSLGFKLKYLATYIQG